jgi:formamidase
MAMGDLIVEANAELTVTRYTRGLIGPNVTPAGFVKNGGRIHAIAPPGCWGPMITPTFHGGHEVTAPVQIEGAEVGDGIALFIEKEWIRSKASASGVMTTNAKAFKDDPFVDKHCPGCGKPWPDYVVDGTGQRAVRCAACGTENDTFGFDEGYTVVFDEERRVGITVTEEIAHRFALDARDLIALPATSEQVPILLYEPGRISSTLIRLRPSIGNIGSTPTRTLPDSHNAGDFGHGLIGANHQYGCTEHELMAAKTDGHLDCMDVRPGAVLIVPVKVPGGGIYLGDAHAAIGEGEIALHGIDITADVTVRVEVIHALASGRGPAVLRAPLHATGIRAGRQARPGIRVAASGPRRPYPGVRDGGHHQCCNRQRGDACGKAVRDLRSGGTQPLHHQRRREDRAPARRGATQPADAVPPAG